MGGKLGMTSRAKIGHAMIPINVGRNRDASERVDRMEERGYNENYTDEGCGREASNMVGDTASSKGYLSMDSHTGDGTHRSDRGRVYLLPSL